MKSAIISCSTLLTILSCGDPRPAQDQQGEGTASELTGDIKVDGSSTVYPITEAVAEEFRNVQVGVKVTIGISGTGGGFKQFARGESDISAASRPIKSNEAADCSKNGISYLELSIAYDGLAVLVNPQNDWVTTLTVAELKKIWEPAAQNKITHWNQIRPEWPREEIHLFGPGIASGTYDYFTEAIVGKSGSSRGDFTASEDDNVLVQGIVGDKFGLGFFGLAYYEENQDKLKLIPVDGGNGPVTPTVETVRNGSYTPLSRPLFIYVSDASRNMPHVNAFVNFYLDQAAQLSTEVGYIPLPDEEYETQKSKFNRFISSAQ